jgi:hypothetical protein
MGGACITNGVEEKLVQAIDGKVGVKETSRKDKT